MATPSEWETTVTMPSDREVVLTRRIHAPRMRVFEAHTDPEHLPRWLVGPEEWTMPVCEVDLRPGGAYRFVLRGPDGAEMELRGVYRDVSPPERLVSDEAWVGDWPTTRNTLTFSEGDSGTTTLTLSVVYPSKEDRDAALRTGMTDGAASSFDRLVGHLRGGTTRPRTEGGIA